MPQLIERTEQTADKLIELTHELRSLFENSKRNAADIDAEGKRER